MSGKESELAEAIYNQLKKNFDRSTLLLISDYLRNRLAKEDNQTEVITAVPLDAGQQDRLREKIAGVSNDHELIFKIDSGLLGGIVIRTPSSIIDASLKKDLTEIGKRIS